MLVCLARCTFILHCSANATRQFVFFFFYSPAGRGKQRRRRQWWRCHQWRLARRLSAGYMRRLVISGHFASKLPAEVQGSAVSISVSIVSCAGEVWRCQMGLHMMLPPSCMELTQRRRGKRQKDTSARLASIAQSSVTLTTRFVKKKKKEKWKVVAAASTAQITPIQRSLDVAYSRCIIYTSEYLGLCVKWPQVGLWWNKIFSGLPRGDTVLWLVHSLVVTMSTPSSCTPVCLHGAWNDS